jgi:hypothetical protein
MAKKLHKNYIIEIIKYTSFIEHPLSASIPVNRRFFSQEKMQVNLQKIKRRKSKIIKQISKTLQISRWRCWAGDLLEE